MRHKAPDSRLNAGACARRKSAALPEVLWAGRKRASVSRQRRHRHTFQLRWVRPHCVRNREILTFSSIKAQNFHIPMPPCKVDVKLKEGTLSFSAVRKLMGNEITVEYTLKIDGDKLKGKGAAEFGGQKQEFDIAGKRDKKDN